MRFLVAVSRGHACIAIRSDGICGAFPKVIAYAASEKCDRRSEVMDLIGGDAWIRIEAVTTRQRPGAIAYDRYTCDE